MDTPEQLSGLWFIRPDALPGATALTDAQRLALDKINQKVAGTESLDAAMTLVADALREVCGCDRLSLHLLESDGQRIVARWVRASYQPVLIDRGYTQDLQGSSLRPILDKGLLRIIPDLDRYLAHNPESTATRLLVREGNHSSLTCPLLVDGRPVGILFASARRFRAFGLPEAQALQSIAERLGQAAEKVYRIEQLSTANTAYMEVLSFVAHEFKEPLASMLTSAQVMEQGFCGPLTPRQADRLASIRRRGNYLIGLVHEYLDLARLEGGELKLKVAADVDLAGDVIDPAVEYTEPARQDAGISLERVLPDPVPRVRADAALLRIVVANLLSNATKYGRRGGRVRLSVQREGQALHVSVWNEGQGFKPADRDHLFRKFTRLDDPAFKGVRGTGVGLYTAWRIVRMHGGRLEAESDYGHWAAFSFSLPL
jgi:signal transduction histidine kinase